MNIMTRLQNYLSFLNGDTDGLYYGYDNIPEKWRSEIKRREDIRDLAERFLLAVAKN